MFASFRVFVANQENTFERIEQHAKNHSLAAWKFPIDDGQGAIWEFVGPADVARAKVAQILQQLAQEGPHQRVFTVLETPIALAIIGPTGVQGGSPVQSEAIVASPAVAERSLDAADVEALLEALSVATMNSSSEYVSDKSFVDGSVRMRWGQLAARLVRPGARILTFVPKQVSAIEVQRVGDGTL